MIEKTGYKSNGFRITTIDGGTMEKTSINIFETLTDKTYKNLQQHLTFTNKMNAIVLQESPIQYKIQQICTAIDFRFNTYSTFTYLKQQPLQFIRSQRFPEQETPNISQQEMNYHHQLMTKYKRLNWSILSELSLHSKTWRIAKSELCENSYFIPVYTMSHEVIGYFIIYFKGIRIGERLLSVLTRKLEQCIQLLEKLSMYERQIEILQTTDTTTNLPSYKKFITMLSHYKNENKVGVIKIIEPGEFSKIVELYGRPVGERLLRHIGECLKQASTSDNSEVARFTSSALIMFSPVDFKHLVKRKTTISDEMNASFTIDDQPIHISLKVGIAPFNSRIANHDAIRFAEYALTKAKGVHGSHTEFYTARNDAVLERELFVLNHLKNAIYNGEIDIHFQPKFALHNEKIISMEALARWYSPELGFISPAEFIPIAENAGLIKNLELQIIEKVLMWHQQRQYEGKRIVPVAVNISPEHFYHPLFIQNLQRLLHTYYADPKTLIIEVTENMGLFDSERARKIINKLRNMGIYTSIDDFGIGYSSLSYLQKFSFNELKIDRSFVMKLDELATQTIVKAIIEIAHTLEMDVIAEGVETKEQRDILKAISCDGIQGYYYSKPLPIEEAEKCIDEERLKRKQIW